MTKQKAISLYTATEDKAIVVKAAKIASLDVSSFCRTAAVEKARKIIKENKTEVIPQ